MMNGEEILELVKKGAKNIAEIITVVFYKITLSVKKINDVTYEWLRQATKETAKQHEQTGTEKGKMVKILLIDKENVLSRSSSPVEQNDSEFVISKPLHIHNLREELFSLIINKIESEKSQKQHFKAFFLKVILSKNTVLFEELMIQLDLFEEKSFKDHAILLDLHNKNPSAIFSSPVLLHVQKELSKEDSKQLISLLLNVFQSIPELSNDKSGICLSMRIKKELLPVLLELTNGPVKKEVLSQLTDLSFDSLLTAFRPSLGDKNYVQMKITHDQYLKTITKGVDPSIFIAITIGYLKSNNLASKEFLQNLSTDYLFVNYESCLGTIEDYFQKLTLPKDFPNGYEKYVHSICQDIKAFDHKRNDTRRFFETRLAQYINGLTHSEETVSHVGGTKVFENLFDDRLLREHTLTATNKILIFFLGDKEGIVSSPIEIERKISIFANGYKDTEKYNPEELVQFMKSCIVYGGRDRTPRAKETGVKERKFETSMELVGEDVWNASGGVMRSTSPTFFDAQCNPMRNMLVDSSEVSPPKESPQWFWSNNRHFAAYVGSISGHTCNIIFMLNSYMKANRNDPNLSEDINLFLIQLVAVYAKRGYHGMLEVMDVLHDPVIQNVFKENQVHIDFTQYFRKENHAGVFLEYALNDTSVYALVLASKQQLKIDLSRTKVFNQQAFKENEQETESVVKNKPFSNIQ